MHCVPLPIREATQRNTRVRVSLAQPVNGAAAIQCDASIGNCV